MNQADRPVLDPSPTRNESSSTEAPADGIASDPSTEEFVSLAIEVNRETAARLEVMARDKGVSLNSLIDSARYCLGEEDPRAASRDEADLASSFDSDAFWDAFPEAFLAWHRLKKALASILVIRGPEGGAAVADEIAGRHSVGELAEKLQALAGDQETEDLADRCLEAYWLWLIIEAGDGTLGGGVDEFRQRCDELTESLYAFGLNAASPAPVAS